jgi:hypothetical protein
MDDTIIVEVILWKPTDTLSLVKDNIVSTRATKSSNVIPEIYRLVNIA